MKKFLSSIKVPHFKNTVECAPISIAPPQKVVIPMAQHIGRPANPVVKIGDLVKIGQVIGEASAFVSAPIHASISGKVTAIDDVMMPNGTHSKAVVITSDGLMEMDESIKAPKVESKEEFLSAVQSSGLVGLGGAGFPAFVKLSIPADKKVDTLVINGAECEPYITSDNRTMLDKAELVIEGINLVRKYTGIPNAKIVVESNKPKGIKSLKDAIGKSEGIEVVTVPSSYPQGAEKVMVYNTTGRVIGAGKLPLDVGVVVMNITSIAFLAEYIRTGKPLVEKVLTLDGSCVAKPGNFIVPIGTPISHLVEQAGGLKDEAAKILMGGPMMGIAVYDFEAPVMKNNNAILIFNEKDATTPKETACINCGRCTASCPFNLMPGAIERAYVKGDGERLITLAVNSCMECGCCSYVCPARKELADTNKAAKAFLRQYKK